MAKTKKGWIIAIIIIIMFMVFTRIQTDLGIQSVSISSSQSACESFVQTQWAGRTDLTFFYTHCFQMTTYAQECMEDRGLSGFGGYIGDWLAFANLIPHDEWSVYEKVEVGCLGGGDYFTNFDYWTCSNTCLSNAQCTGCGDSYYCDTGVDNPHCKKTVTIECYDSDLGKNEFAYGNTLEIIDEVPQTPFKDSCVDSDTVKEYYCSGGDVRSQNIDCPDLSFCDEGMCLQSFDFAVHNIQITKDGDNVGQDHILVQMDVTSHTEITGLVEAQISTYDNPSIPPIQSLVWIHRNQCDELRGEPSDWHYRNEYVDFAHDETHTITFEFTPEELGNPFYIYFNIGSSCCTEFPCTTGDDFYSIKKIGQIDFGSSVSVCGPADNNPQDNSISRSEVISYATLWVNSQGPTRTDVISVANKWVNGQC